jgi:hypothetical protein
MGTERELGKGVPAPNADDQEAKRKRRLLRAAEAFKKRAEATERRWLGGLSNRGKPRSR